MAPLLLYLLIDDLQNLLLSRWLDAPSLGILDTAVLCNAFRPFWITAPHSLRATALDNMDHSTTSLMWLSRRGICVSRMQMKVDTWERLKTIDLSSLKTVDLVHLAFNGCSRITDQSILMIVTRCRKLISLHLEGCSDVTDAVPLAVGHGCGQLQSINLVGCKYVTDAGIIALSK